jgi:hypothetical protein
LAQERAEVGDKVAIFIEHGLSSALLRLLSAEDHLGTIGDVLTAGDRLYSTFSLARVTCELSARVSWFLDANTAMQRARRGLVDWRESLAEQGKLPMPEAKNHAADRRRVMFEMAGRAGLEVGQEKWLKPTELVNSMWRSTSKADRGTFLYKYLSGIGHGTSFALHGLLVDPTGLAAEEVRPGVT